jgi:hypothetical protein
MGYAYLFDHRNVYSRDIQNLGNHDLESNKARKATPRATTGTKTGLQEEILKIIL